MESTLKIEILSTGDEVLYGQIVDTNAVWLSDFLFQQGFAVTSRMTLGDNLSQLVTALQSRTIINDILIVNGGLGPTKDDLSTEAAAKANNESLVLQSEWVTVMESYFIRRGREMPSSNLKQALLPESAVIVDNPIGTACGFRMLMNDCIVFFTPGVPSEFKLMIENEIVPYLRQQFDKVDKPLCYRLTTMGRSESDIAVELETKLNIPEGIDLGYRSDMPIIELKLTAPQTRQSEMDKLWSEIKQCVKDNTLYEGTTNLAKLITEQLIRLNQKIIVIEQSTQGQIAYRLYQEDAPIIKSEVLNRDDEILPYLAHLHQLYPDALILAMVDFNETQDQFTLIFSRKNSLLQYRLQYKGRKPNRIVEQNIYSTIALDALHSYLLDLQVIRENSWLEIIE